MLGKINLNALLDSITPKINELETQLKTLEHKEQTSSVRVTLSKTRHELGLYTIIGELCQQFIELDENDPTIYVEPCKIQWFDREISGVQKQRKAALELNIGDNVMEFLMNNTSYTMTKLLKILNENGMEVRDGIVVRK